VVVLVEWVAVVLVVNMPPTMQVSTQLISPDLAVEVLVTNLKQVVMVVEAFASSKSRCHNPVKYCIID
jgi:hypothetical protein